jgi:hypothetical protein
LFKDKQDARNLLSRIDKRIGVEQLDKDYHGYFVPPTSPNASNGVFLKILDEFDCFVFSHFLGNLLRGKYFVDRSSSNC